MELNKEFFRSLNTEKFPVSDEQQAKIEQRCELIQRPAKDYLLKDGWYVDIDIETYQGVQEFIVVKGRDKFDAIAKANLVYEKLNEIINKK